MALLITESPLWWDVIEYDERGITHRAQYNKFRYRKDHALEMFKQWTNQ